MAILTGTPNDDILDLTDPVYDAAIGLGNDDLIIGDDGGNTLIGDGGNGYDGTAVYAEGGDDAFIGGDGEDLIIGDNHTVGSLNDDLGIVLLLVLAEHGHGNQPAVVDLS